MFWVSRRSHSPNDMQEKYSLFTLFASNCQNILSFCFFRSLQRLKRVCLRWEMLDQKGISPRDKLDLDKAFSLTLSIN